MSNVDTRAPQVNVDLQHGDPWTLNVTSADTVPTTLAVWIALRQSTATPLLTLTRTAITGGQSYALTDEQSLSLSPSKAYQLVARDSATGVTWFTGPVKPSTEGAPGPTSQTVSVAISEASITVDITVAAGSGGGGGGGVEDDDPRLSDARTPTGGAGGFLSGTYPNPGVNSEALQDAVGAMAGTGLTYDDTAGVINGLDALAVVVYDFDADEYPARPDATVVRWIGPTTPTAWIDFDEWREVEPPPTVPDAPTSVAATAGDTEVDLTWTGPVDNGGSALTGYRITPFIGATAQTAIDVGVVTSYTVTGLTNDTAYTFTVAAQNSVGVGAASAPSDEVTPAEPVVAITREQSKTAGAATTNIVRSVTFDTAPTEGNLLIAYIVSSGSNVTFSMAAGWTQAAVASYGSSNQGRVAIWWKVAGAAESSTVTVTLAPSGASSGMSIEEWSGIATTSPLEGATSIGSGAGTNATTLTLPSVGPVSQPDVLAVAVVGGALDLTLSSWTGGFAATAASTTARVLVGNLVSDTESATISTAPSWTPNTVTAAVMAVFKGL